MVVLDKPISRAEYYASRYDKQKAQDKENKAREERSQIQPGQPLYLEVTDKGVSNEVLTAPDKKATTNLKTNTREIFPNDRRKTSSRFQLINGQYSTYLPDGTGYKATKQQTTNTNNEPTGRLRKGYSNVERYESNILSYKNQLKGQYNTPYVVKEKARTRATLLGIGAYKATVYPFIYPKETAVSAWNIVRYPGQTWKQVKSEVKTNPYGFVGSFAGVGVLGKAGKGSLIVARNTRLRLFTSNVSSSKFLEPKSRDVVISGAKGNMFPTASSIGDALKKFNRGKTSKGLKVVSVSPKPLNRMFLSKNVRVGPGTGVRRTEGLYNSAMGLGSTYFSGIRKESGYSFSVLPKFERLKPTITVTTVGGVSRIPRKVLMRGVDAENAWLTSKSGSGRVYITGNLERTFDRTLPRFTSNGKKTFNTNELEAVSVKGSVLKYRGMRESTKLSYYRVGVEEFDLVKGSTATKSSVSLRNIKNPLFKSGRYDSSSGIYYRPKSNVSIVGSAFRASYANSLKRISGFDFDYSTGTSSYRSTKQLYGVSSRNGYSMSRSRYFTSRSRYSTSNNSYSNSYSSNNSSGGYIFTSKKLFPGIETKNNNRRDKTPVVKKDSITKGLFRSGYSPSIEASLFNVRALRIRKSYANTGLVLRPILGGK